MEGRVILRLLRHLSGFMDSDSQKWLIINDLEYGKGSEYIEKGLYPTETPTLKNRAEVSLSCLSGRVGSSG